MAHRPKPKKSGRDLTKYNKEHAQQRRQKKAIERRGKGSWAERLDAQRTQSEINRGVSEEQRQERLKTAKEHSKTGMSNIPPAEGYIKYKKPTSPETGSKGQDTGSKGGNGGSSNTEENPNREELTVRNNNKDNKPEQPSSEKKKTILDSISSKRKQPGRVSRSPVTQFQYEKKVARRPKPKKKKLKINVAGK